MDPATIAAVVSGLGLAGTGLNTWFANRAKGRAEEVKLKLEEKNTNFDQAMRLVEELRTELTTMRTQVAKLNDDLLAARADMLAMRERIFELEHPKP
jgi:septal ring factor EnvC (AmiA/AmiB activator)